jgi:hypothetical protein
MSLPRARLNAPRTHQASQQQQNVTQSKQTMPEYCATLVAEHTMTASTTAVPCQPESMPYSCSNSAQNNKMHNANIARLTCVDDPGTESSRAATAADGDTDCRMKALLGFPLRVAVYTQAMHVDI